MKLGLYIKDKVVAILISLFMYLIIILMLWAFKCDGSLIVGISVVFFLGGISIFGLDFIRRKKFYDELLLNIDRLDKKYLVLETLETPDFYEGQIFCQALYDINKSMCELINGHEAAINSFKEYIEMWIHEIKIPIASLVLMAHNNKEIVDKRGMAQIRGIENYVDQVLYYVRSENASYDYLIKENDLSKIIGAVALKNKDDLLENEIDFRVRDVNYQVFTDSKWLEFILNQIISNAIKYKRDTREAYIEIYTTIEDERVTLNIYDNGIGIKAADLSRVFDKCFTGYNGRLRSKSTGMGLYIAWKLCKKLGHKIEIESKEGGYTVVKITFSKDGFYDCVK